MPVELDHLGCDITELGKHFLPKYLHYVSGGKNVKGTIMSPFFIQNQGEKEISGKVFLLRPYSASYAYKKIFLFL